MKLRYLFVLPILATALMGCDEIEMSDAKPVENPQLPLLTDGDLEFAASELVTAGQVNLTNYKEPASPDVPVVDLTKAENLPDGAEVVLNLELSKNADFSDSKTISLTPGAENANLYYADAYAWNDAQIAFFGKTLKAQTVYYRIPVYITLDGALYRYQANDFYALDSSVAVARMAPDYVIEDNYYVYGPFIGGNNPGAGVKMYHDDTQDVYDNPVFTYLFNVTQEELDSSTGFTLMIAPESQHNAQGTSENCYGRGDVTGVAVLGGQPIQVFEAGPYQLEFNAENLTYTVKMASNSLYVMSMQQGAVSMDFNQASQLGTNDYVTYTGLAGILNSWALTGQAAWRPTMYINNPNVEPETEGNLTTGTAMVTTAGPALTAENGLAMPGRHRGLFYLTFNVQTAEYTAYYCNTLGLVGTINNWGNDGDKDIALSGSLQTRYMTWKATVTLAADDEFKVRANNEWGPVNLGSGSVSQITSGVPVELVNSGDSGNFTVAEAGTYDIEINFQRQYVNGTMTPYTMTLTKK